MLAVLAPLHKMMEDVCNNIEGSVKRLLTKTRDPKHFGKSLLSKPLVVNSRRRSIGVTLIAPPERKEISTKHGISITMFSAALHDSWRIR